MWVFVMMLCGYDMKDHVNIERIPFMPSNNVGGTSSKNMNHWAQLYKSQLTRYYDYGPELNLQYYNSSEAPLYPVQVLPERLSKVPILLLSALNDLLAPDHNIAALSKVLPDPKTQVRGSFGILYKPTVEQVVIEDYNHMDFLLALDAKEVVNKPIIDFLKRNIVSGNQEPYQPNLPADNTEDDKVNAFFS